MVWSSARPSVWFEVAVVLFQVIGVASLCLNRLAPYSRWRECGRLGFILALFGLGVAGACCGGHDSEFSLFAGGTMTFLLIGMTAGSGHHDTTAIHRRGAHVDAVPAS
ncbi:MAG: hypothetical protein U0794_23245 [Isosphaeraceae bacterium]